MNLPKHKLCARKTELGIEVKLYPEIQWVYMTLVTNADQLDWRQIPMFTVLHSSVFHVISQSNLLVGYGENTLECDTTDIRILTSTWRTDRPSPQRDEIRTSTRLVVPLVFVGRKKLSQREGRCYFTHGLYYFAGDHYIYSVTMLTWPITFTGGTNLHFRLSLSKAFLR